MPVNRRRRASLVDTASRALTERTTFGRRLVAMRAELRSRRVPLHWTHVFGVITMASLAVLFVTGVILMFAYDPSSELARYEGPYAPLHGAEASGAFISVMRLSFEVPGGLLLRQLHHWAGLLVPVSIVLQLLVSFFTGAFRRPRRANWVLLFLLFVVTLAGGWSGYALPDDMLSGSGLRIVEGIVLGIPVIGTWLASLLFGGAFPGAIIENLYGIHVLIAPAALLLIVVVRAWRAYRIQPPQFAGSGRREDNIVGVPLPTAATRAGGVFAVVTAALFVVASTVTVGPIWLYGPSDPGSASAGSQPDWYTGFLDGALRLVPPGWEFEWMGRTVTLAVLVPLAVVGVFLLVVAVYPFLEGWVLRDTEEHHLLDRPRNVASRTAIGVAGIVFYATLWGAASADIISTSFRVGLETVITTFQVTLIVGPVVGFVVARRIALALQKKDLELAVHGYETGRIVRLPGGRYVEMHEQLDGEERARLARHVMRPIAPRPNEAGRLTPLERLRGALAERFFADRVVVPKSSAETTRALTAGAPEGAAGAEPAEGPEPAGARSLSHVDGAA